MSAVGHQEPVNELSAEAREMHRALISLQEELEAIDFYAQRLALGGDARLGGVLKHNRDEEKEHAAMLLAWIRQDDPAFSSGTDAI